MFCGSSCAQTISSRFGYDAASSAQLDRERVELLEPRDRDRRRAGRAPRGRRCRSRPSPSRARAGARARRSTSADRRGPAGTARRRARRGVDDACLSRSSPFGVITTSGRAVGVERLAPQQVEVLGGGRAVRDADVLLRGELEEALEPRARVLGPVALVAVREQQRQARGLPPLREAGDDELVDDDLRAVDEVAELRLPEDERVGRGDRVAVLEAERGELGQRRVVDLERRLGVRQVLERRVRLAGLQVVQHACRCENVPRSVSWPDSRIGMPSSSRLAKASASACPQSMPPSRSASRRRSSCFASFGCTLKPSRHGEQLLVQRLEPGRAGTAVSTAPPVSAGIRPSFGARGSRDRRLQPLVRRAELRLRLVEERGGLLRGLTTPSAASVAAYSSRTVGWSAICATISGCV